MRLCRCGEIVKGQCKTCDGAESKYKSFYSSNAWRILSERKRIIDPLCERCMSVGKTKPATEVHHIVGVEVESLRLSIDNLMSVCGECHDVLDAERRAARTGGGRNVR